jgi:hypothetical protein
MLMDNKLQIKVNLPALHASATLPRRLEKVLELIIEADFMGINTIQLHNAGCIAPSKAVCELRAVGILIKTQFEDACDANGELHKRVAHYFYYGWQFDALQLENTLFGADSI